MNSGNTDKLEAAVGGMLRRLPPRKAPHSLEARVMAEIARRAALPWWRKSYAHWPMAAKAGFVGTCALAAALVVLALMAAGRTDTANHVAGRFSSALATLSLVRDIAVAAALRLKSYLATVPALLLYGAIAAVASAYAALAALGAAAYRLVGAPQHSN